MAFEITDTAQDQANRSIKHPSLVLEIEGYDFKFSLSQIIKNIQIDDYNLFIDTGWLLDSSGIDYSSLTYITKDGTTQSINQQIQHDKGGATSITSIQINLLDYREFVTRLISPNFELPDLLGRRAWVYLGFQETVFPKDYIVLFTGVIDEILSTGTITLNVSHPEQLKRQEVFVKSTSNLNGAITNSDVTLTLDSVDNFLLPYSTEFLTYVRINDEIIQYTGIDTGNNQLTGCVRGQFGTIAVAHDDDDEVNTFYRLLGNPNEMALKIMLSGVDYNLSGLSVTNFELLPDLTTPADTLFISGVDVKQKYGITIGDFITTEGASNGANNVTLETISNIEIIDEGSVITVSGAGFVSELGTSATLSIKSRYNVYPDGMGMNTNEVDVDEFDRVYDIFNSYMPDLDFYLVDTVKGKSFIDEEVLYPSNMYTLPRKGRVSLGYVSPPLAVGTLQVLDSSNVIKPDKIQIKRSIGRYFYNTIIYKYDFDAVETDRPLAGYIRTDEDSKTRIPVGTKSLIIESGGFRNNTDTTQKLDIMSTRAVERYKFAAETIAVSVFYGVGYRIEIGDVVYFGDEDLKIVDTKNATRGFQPRLCEVVEKRMNYVTGQVDLVLLDSGYSAAGRYGIFSPSSIVSSGSTVSQVVIQQSYGTTGLELEKSKWIPYIGEKILIRDESWITTYQSVLRGFDATNPNIMLIDTIGGVPTAGMVVDIIQYPNDSDPTESLKYKSIHCYFNPTISITAGSSSTAFSVGVSDASKLFVGCTIRVHDDDFSDDSGDVRVLSLIGTDVVVDTDLGFTPSSSHFIDLVGFSADSGPAYRYL